MEKRDKFKKIFKEALSYIIIILIVIIIRVFIFDPIRVDGPSMNNTLKDGQILILNKFIYKKSDINRYDIVVIKLDNGEKIIKRVIGLPNEEIEIKDNKIYANGEEIDNSFAATITDDFNTSEKLGLKKVPGDKYFVLGDNREISKDSRVLGFIREDQIPHNLRSLPSIKISRNDGTDCSRHFSQQFVNVIVSEICSLGEGVIINVFATTNPKHNISIAESAFKKADRGNISRIYVFRQKKIGDRNFEEKGEKI